MMKRRKLRRTQLDQFFKDLKSLNLRAPKLGWVKEIRESLGMSMQDLGDRMGVLKQRIERIEKDELGGKTTLETMKKTAEALNCEFIYFLVPKNTLEETLKAQAHKSAADMMNQVAKTMSLEDQGTSKKSQKELVNNLAQEMLLNEDRKIWRQK